MSFYIGWRIRRNKAEDFGLPPKSEELKVPPRRAKRHRRKKSWIDETGRRSDPTDETGTRSDPTEIERRS